MPGTQPENGWGNAFLIVIAAKAGIQWLLISKLEVTGSLPSRG
jgi:hypothetical protein